MPVNTPVRMVINSVDVLHSLYIPSFRTKMDAVPGRYTDLWFKATQAGEFPIFCAEYCGTSHSDMITRVIVHPPGGYEKWLARTIAAADSLTGVDRGKMLYEKQGCATCHSTRRHAQGRPVLEGHLRQDGSDDRRRADQGRRKLPP